MLHAVAHEDLCRAIVTMDGQCDGHRTFWEFEAVTLRGRNLQVVSDKIKLPARHAERWGVVDFHGGRISRKAGGPQSQRQRGYMSCLATWAKWLIIRLC